MIFCIVVEIYLFYSLKCIGFVFFWLLFRDYFMSHEKVNDSRKSTRKLIKNVSHLDSQI